MDRIIQYMFRAAYPEQAEKIMVIPGPNLANKDWV